MSFRSDLHTMVGDPVKAAGNSSVRISPQPRDKLTIC